MSTPEGPKLDLNAETEVHATEAAPPPGFEHPETALINDDSIRPTRETAAFSQEKLEGQWLIMTEVIRQEALSNSAVRAQLEKFAAEPVGEFLPSKALETLGRVSPRINALAHHYDEQLLAYLHAPSSLETEPDTQITADTMRVEKTREAMADGRFSDVPGLGRITTRYAFARDIKILSLGADITSFRDQNNQIGDTETLILPSGTKIRMNTHEAEIVADLMNPQTWEKKEMPDKQHRVFYIIVNEHQYILKEKRTAEHGLKGHKGVIDSDEEFAIAKNMPVLADGGDGVSGKWETPLAGVTFPDGYQFTIYKFEENLVEYWDAAQILERAIIEQREQFEEEYQQLLAEARTLLKSPAVQNIENMPSIDKSSLIVRGLAWFGQRTGILKASEAPILSFKEFATIKAVCMRAKARDWLHSSPYLAQFQAGDGAQNVYRVDESRAGLEVIGFDFEHFKKVTPEKAAQEQERYNQNNAKRALSDVVSETLSLNPEIKLRGIITASCYAFLKREGILD